MTWEDLSIDAIEAYTRSRSTPPAWSTMHMYQVNLLLETPRGKTLTKDQFLEQLQRFFDSPDKFAPIRAGSIKYFCEHFDEFGPAEKPKAQAEPRKVCAECHGTGRRFVKQERGKAAVTAPCGCVK